MKNIKNFSSFINENNSKVYITPYNFEDYKSKILTIVALQNNPELKKAYDFCVKNIDEYSDEFVRDMIDPFISEINTIIKKNPKLWKSEDAGYSGNKFTGSKYDMTRNLSKTEIAKLIKKELDIEFPDWKFSVKTPHRSINVEILDIPYNPFTEYYDELYKKDEEPSYGHRGINDKYNERYLRDLSKMKKIWNQYNFDDSVTQSDYFSVNYYGDVDLNDHNVMKKFYPEHKEVKRHEEYWKGVEERTKKAKELADAKKGKFKKGEKILYIYDRDSSVIPKGEYEGVILKAPNGRGRGFSTYTIRFSVNKVYRNGVEVELEKPLTYTTELYDESKIKPI
jgi:hypothetical protein